MRCVISLITLCALSWFSIGCANVVTPTLGVIYTRVTWGSDANGPTGPKRGEACVRSVMGIVAVGDAGIAAAARQGGIQNVTAMEYRSERTMGFVSRFCTIAYGS
ncbi:MAG: TRL-like family protein [Myxococcales bacterium]|nr:TRL-like family protein [Myxococcales bacterium]